MAIAEAVTKKLTGIPATYLLQAAELRAQLRVWQCIGQKVCLHLQGKKAMVHRCQGVAKYICNTCDADSLEQREHQTSCRRFPFVPSSAYDTNTLLHDSASCSSRTGQRW